MHTDVTTLDQLALLSKSSWVDHSCFIVGSGPSLMAFDLRRLEGYRTISLNGALMLFDPTIAFSMDGGWVRECQTGKHGPELMWKWLSHPCRLYQNAMEYETPGASSGLNAIKLAVWLGASKIFLIGMDFGYPDGKAEYAGDLMRSEGASADRYDQCLPAINRWATQYNGPAHIVNLNPDSNLRCFEFGEIDEVLPVTKEQDNGREQCHA